jgi:hypothetical protein
MILSYIKFKEKLKMAQINRKHWIIRVNDGINFKNSKYPFWGVKRGKNNAIKTIVSKIKVNDVLWFMTSKLYGGKLIGMCEYTGFYDRQDEPLIQVNILSNAEQGWIGNDDWDIQLQYKNLYNTEKQNIIACIQCSATILDYDTFKHKIEGDLDEHYINFKFYAEPKKID